MGNGILVTWEGAGQEEGAGHQAGYNIWMGYIRNGKLIRMEHNLVHIHKFVFVVDAI